MKNKVFLIGNAHIDPVWLWRWQDGFAEIKQTFRSALDRMNEFEDFKFTSACSLYYMWIEKSDKKMFKEIQKRVAEGRWNIVGGWFIQPDCNIPSGESFARHALISQRYFKDKFGITAKTGYNVDSFGHNGNIPKILKQSGMENYVFMRPNESEKELPQSLFNWKSSDGSSVKAFRIPYSYAITTENFEGFEIIKNTDESTPLMAFYGVGNHGGGPTIELLEKMHNELDEGFIFSTVDEYFKSVENTVIPISDDDLQFHAKGCYSACSQIKTNNRLSENMLIEAEKYSALSNHLTDTEYPSDDIQAAWKNVLFNQFHDILGGCSIKSAYDDALYAHGEAMNIASRTTNFALQQISWNIDTSKGLDITADKKGFNWVCDTTKKLGIPIVIFNPLPFNVKQFVTVNYPPSAVKTDDGEEIPIQKIRAPYTLYDLKWLTGFTAEIPALGYSVYRIHNNEAREFENPFLCTENSIETNKLKLSLNTLTGEISQIFIKESAKNLLSDETRTVFIDETDSDTWAHDIKQFKNVAGVCKSGSVRLIENGPVRATLRSTMKLFDTEIIRDYTVEYDSERILVNTTIDFHEKHKMLKFSLPVNVSNPEIYAKIPFGSIKRPNDGSEQICGEWVSIFDKENGIILANSNKYSFDAEENILSLTVLRGSIYADHCFGKTEYHDEFCEYMDQGIHKFTYSISPFSSLSQAEKEGEILNCKPTCIIETFHKGNLGRKFSGITISKPNIAVTALKKHEDKDAWILRCYETQNEDTEVEITLFGVLWKTFFSHNEVKTFVIEDKNVTETNFIELKL